MNKYCVLFVSGMFCTLISVTSYCLGKMSGQDELRLHFTSVDSRFQQRLERCQKIRLGKMQTNCTLKEVQFYIDKNRTILNQ